MPAASTEYPAIDKNPTASSAVSLTWWMPDAGWYQDPHDPDGYRWWDGSRWSDQIHKDTAADAAAERQPMTDAEAGLPVETPGTGDPFQSHATEPPAQSADKQKRFGEIGRRGRLLAAGIVALIVIAGILIFTSDGSDQDSPSNDTVHVVRSSSQFSERKKTADTVARQQLDSLYVMVKLLKRQNHGHYPSKAQLLAQLKAMRTGLTVVVGEKPKQVPGKLVIISSSSDKVKISTASTVGGTVFSLIAGGGKVKITP